MQAGGSEQWMAPEAFTTDRAHLTLKADIFSLHVVFYEVRILLMLCKHVREDLTDLQLVYPKCGYYCSSNTEVPSMSGLHIIYLSAIEQQY